MRRTRRAKEPCVASLRGTLRLETRSDGLERLDRIADNGILVNAQARWHIVCCRCVRRAVVRVSTEKADPVHRIARDQRQWVASICERVTAKDGN